MDEIEIVWIEEHFFCHKFLHCLMLLNIGLIFINLSNNYLETWKANYIKVKKNKKSTFLFLFCFVWVFSWVYLFVCLFVEKLRKEQNMVLIPRLVELHKFSVLFCVYNIVYLFGCSWTGNWIDKKFPKLEPVTDSQISPPVLCATLSSRM